MDVTEAAAGYPSHWRASGTSQNLPVLAPGFGLSVSCGAFGSATGSLFDLRLVLLPFTFPGYCLEASRNP